MERVHTDESSTPSGMLHRTVGIPGAVLLGLGSILGTGVFVSLGLATELAGPWVLAAIAVALLLALFNGLSSAQLAAACPVSGGTYEYGTRLVSPGVGFTAGWLFLCAKSASAASAALGAAVYLLGPTRSGDTPTVVGTALGIVVLTTLVVLLGLRRSNRVNAIIVGIVLVGLVLFVVGSIASGPPACTTVTAVPRPSGLPEAVAIVFVGFTGYGRVATLGEEIRDPGRSIPRAVIATICVAGALYLLVGSVLAWTAPAELLVSSNAATSPLEQVATHHGGPTFGVLVAICAITAMLGVLLNLLLGLSRVMLAMGRRGDMPGVMATVDATTTTPIAAVIAVACIITALVLIGDLTFAWTLSALTVLGYYGITNLSALRLPAADRRFPAWTAVAGLTLCIAAACSLSPQIWLAGGVVLLAGHAWRVVFRLIRPT